MDVVVHFVVKNEEDPGKCMITANGHIALSFSNYIYRGNEFVIYPSCKSTIVLCNNSKNHTVQQCKYVTSTKNKIICFVAHNNSKDTAIHVFSGISLLTLIDDPNISLKPSLTKKNIYKKYTSTMC